MHVYRRLSHVRRIVFWSATALYVVTFPFIILDVTGIVVRPEHPTTFVQTGALEVMTRPDGCELIVAGRPERPLTPAVVEGLRPGRHEIEVRGPSGITWRGAVDIAAAEVTRIKGLPLAPPAVTRVSVAAGVKTARRSLVSASVLLASTEEPRLSILDLAAGRLVPVRPGAGPVQSRGTIESVTPLLADAEFLVETAQESERGALLLDQSALGGWSITDLPFGLPAGVLPLAASWRERAVIFLDGQRVVQRSAAGDRTLLAMNAPIVAVGAAAGVVMLLDSEGTLYHQVRFLAPRVAATYALGPLASAPAGTRGRIVAQKGAVLAVQAATSLYLLTRSRAVEVPGVGGAAFDEVRERIIVWSANRVGRLDHPWIEAEAPRSGQPSKEPTLSWILEAEGAVQRAVPTRDGDSVLLVTDHAVLVCVLTERVLLEPLTLATLEPGEVRPVIDPSGAIVRAAEPRQLQLMRLAPLLPSVGEPR
jgi:hypothetical protein